MRGSVVWALLGAVYCGSLVAGCGDGGVVRDEPTIMLGGDTGSPSGGKNANNGGAMNGNGAGGSVGVPEGKGVGEACTESGPCRPGLSCSEGGECQPAGETAVGDACVISGECKSGQCVSGQCVEAGTGETGAECGDNKDADCAPGFRCAIQGLSLTCVAEGAGDVGAACASSLDCYSGLGCYQQTCAPAPVGLPPLGEPWTGVECAKPVEADVKAYFEVPGADGADEGDFFRLPFPSDVRKNGDALDLSGFPTPGAGLLGVDPVKLYVDAITENDSGWGAYPTVFFRFSGRFEFGSFADNALRYYDITDPAEPHSLGWSRWFTNGRSNYICDNFVAVRTETAHPLKPGHRYAVFLLGEADGKTLVGENDGKPVTRSANLDAVLAAKAPSDAKLKAAYAVFAPFREFLAGYKDKDDKPVFDSDNVLTATVFTVGDVQAPMAELAAAVAKAPEPTATDWVKCGPKVTSPCPQADDDRGCNEDPKGYDEYQALLSLPVFQQGTAPYLTPQDGGGINSKKPHAEKVCLSVTVPEGTAPQAGWPAVVFAHGTGGSFRSHVRAEVAGALSSGTAKFAVIGIDQVEHGPRRGESTESPNHLFFNFLNPAVTRGNPLQGAADQLSVARFAKALDIDAQTSGGAAIKIDGTKLVFFGHSQGSTEGSLMLPFGDDYRAAVLSGNGASLRDALRTKTKPENIAAALPYVLQDPAMLNPDLGGLTANHPVLALLQQWIDPADPLNFAGNIGTPLPDHQAKHVFQTFGLEDSYSPPITMATFATAAGLTQIDPDASASDPYNEDKIFGNWDKNPPVAVGYQAAKGAFTLGVRQYGAPKGSDGHFVVFDTQAANDDAVLFLTGAVGAMPPVIGQ